jgi:hypothetical protein
LWHIKRKIGFRMVIVRRTLFFLANDVYTLYKQVNPNIGDIKDFKIERSLDYLQTIMIESTTTSTTQKK